MNQRVHLIAERLWGIIALVALLAALYHISQAGWEDGKSALLFPGIAGAWYLTRRGLRRKLSASDDAS
jgi:hypothetical protein